MSGIGCSSKTPDYFLGASHGFNSVHGRMPSVATGAALANRDLTYLGVSGDGDSASIGLGQFAHAMRRGVNMTYIVENNEAVNKLEVILARHPIETSYAPGTLRRVVQHDGSVLLLRKLGLDYDPTDRIGAMNHLHKRAALGEIATGLLYVDEGAEDMHRHLNTVETPLNQLGDAELCPGSAVLESINASLR